LRWLAGIVAAVIQPTRYFSRPTYPAASSDVAAEKRADGAVEGVQAVVTAAEDAVARPTTVKSFTAPITPGCCSSRTLRPTLPSTLHLTIRKLSDDATW